MHAPADYESLLTPEYARSVIWKVTAQTGNPMLDEDLIQDCLLRALIAGNRQKQIEYPYSFFRKIVRDTVVDCWRRYRPPGETLEVLDGNGRHSISHSKLEEMIDRKRTLNRIQQVTTCLSSADRELFDAYYRNGLSIRHIAETKGRTQSSIKMSLLRSRKRIRQSLQTLSANS